MPNTRSANAVRLDFTPGCLVQSNLSGGKAGWLVLYDAPGADRKEGEHTVLSDLLRHD